MSRRDVLAGLVDAWLFEASTSNPLLAAPFDDVVGFLEQRLDAMPDYLRWPIKILTGAFDLSAVPRHGARFQNLDRESRKRHAQAWSASRLGPRRDLMTLYQSLANYALYARLDDAA